MQILKDETKNQAFEEIIKTYIEYLSIGIANFARICSSDVVVIGGSFVHFKDVLWNILLKELDRIMIPMEREKTTIKLATLGNDAGIIGGTRILENS